MPNHDSSKNEKNDAPPEWQKLAREASEEPDAQRVFDIVTAMCDNLDDAEAARKKRAAQMRLPQVHPDGDGHSNGDDHNHSAPSGTREYASSDGHSRRNTPLEDS